MFNEILMRFLLNKSFLGFEVLKVGKRVCKKQNIENKVTIFFRYQDDRKYRANEGLILRAGVLFFKL